MKGEENLRQQAVGGAVWKFSEKFGVQLMQIVIQIILARLLSPDDYGMVGLLTIFINISDVFLLQGFTTALIQKKEADELDFASVYFANLVLSVLLYGVFFWLAPYVALFYDQPQLTQLMRVLSLNVIIGAFCAVHNAIVSKKLAFRLSFMRNIASTLTQGVAGILMALTGFGVWSLVGSRLAGTFVGTVVLCVTVAWRPQFHFSAARLRTLFSFSSKLLGSNLLNTIFNNIHSLIIGHFFTAADVGYYQRGQQIPHAVMTAVDGSMSEVLYPTLSLLQKEPERLKGAMRRSMKTSMFLALPMLMGLLVVAEPMTLLLLTEKWLPSVPFMQLTCLITAFWPLAARTHALNAIGRSDVSLRLSLISKVLTLICIAVCIPFGIYAIMLGTLGASLIDFWITTGVVKKYLHYTVRELFWDLAPTVMVTTAMMVVVALCGQLQISLLPRLSLQIAVGVTFYSGVSWVIRLEPFLYLWHMGINMLNKHKPKGGR